MVSTLRSDEPKHWVDPVSVPSAVHPVRRRNSLSSHSLRVPGDLHEAHLPAQHPQASNEAWLPCSQSNSGRPRCSAYSPPQGPSQAECVTASVTRRSTFAALARGDRARHGAVRVRFIGLDHPDMQPGTRVALSFAFPRSFGNAVERNRAKRRLRHAFLDADGASCDGTFLMTASRAVLDLQYDHLVADVRRCLEPTRATS